jgi:hypothetical protein
MPQRRIEVGSCSFFSPSFVFFSSPFSVAKLGYIIYKFVSSNVVRLPSIDVLLLFSNIETRITH